MNKKYILTDETRVLSDTDEYCTRNVVVSRIKAIKDFGTVRTGDIGGWVETEANLFQEGTCWVHDNAIVMSGGVVMDSAQVLDNACLKDDASARGNSIIGGNAKLSGICDVSGSATVCDHAVIDRNACIRGAAIIGGDANISLDAEIGGATYVSGNAYIGGNVTIESNGVFNDDAYIRSDEDFLVVPTLNSTCSSVTFFRNFSGEVKYILCGMHGSLPDFRKAYINYPECISRKMNCRIYEQAVEHFGVAEQKDRPSYKKENEKTVEAPAWIYSTPTFDLDVNKAFNKVEEILGFKLFYWQKYYILFGQYRCFGDTTAKILSELLFKSEPLELRAARSVNEKTHQQSLIEMHQKLKSAGFPVRDLTIKHIPKELDFS